MLLAMRALVCLAALLLSPLSASAQGRVAIDELTVDGDPPPDEYRTLLSNALRPHLEEIRDVYGRRLAERPGVGGDYRLRLWVSAHEVIRITPESSLGDDTLERQTREAIYRFRLPPEAPAGGAWVRFVVRFTPPASGPGSAGSAPALPPPAPATAPDAGTAAPGYTAVLPGVAVPSLRLPTVRIDRITGALSESALGGALPVPALGRCVGPAGGDLPVRVSIDRRGRVSASPARGTLRHRATVRCIEEAIEALTFAPEAGPTRARITVTIPPPPAD
jgi:hypothetical protein